MPKLKIQKKGRKEYYVQNIDDTGPEWCGPYDSYTEAVEAREGLTRTLNSKTWIAVEQEWKTLNEKRD